MNDFKLPLDIKILLIDDMDSVRKYFRDILEVIGFKDITEAKDGAEGYNHLCTDKREGKPFELIFLDINMPVMDGIEFLLKLNEDINEKKPQVIMLTTVNDKEVVLKTVALGASNYILKPFDLDIVKEKIISVLS